MAQHRAPRHGDAVFQAEIGNKGHQHIQLQLGDREAAGAERALVGIAHGIEGDADAVAIGIQGMGGIGSLPKRRDLRFGCMLPGVMVPSQSIRKL
ncbi:hypothetical protein QWZ10_03665 [Paracoccus cavernae]|uniref:Uncharacterized protein n=1 Tax=Paracoccus cavernae TaxID=1571207 RepID=A0ABT8D5H1_9RHOB|nr:hypothetical protein [Paracoccus cavernae]